MFPWFCVPQYALWLPKIWKIFTHVYDYGSFQYFSFYFTELSISGNTPDPKTPKSKPVLDKNQPTIEKLFVTPVRKRKRPSAVSPMATTTPSNNEGKVSA